MSQIEEIKADLLNQIAASSAPAEALRSPKLRQLYRQIGNAEPEARAELGQRINDLKATLQAAVDERQAELAEVERVPIDVTAPFDINSTQPTLLPTEQGTVHPLMREIDSIIDIFARMGFSAEESREIDSQFHMFESLNFPKDHPARDEYDTFQVAEKDEAGDPYVAPAHTSTMQNRILKKYRSRLDAGQPIAAIVPDRVFRNEDVDARHEHTFYQLEGVYVDRDVNVGNLISTLKAFLEEYYQQSLEVRVNPFYFPFTEPSFEFSLSCPFCDGRSVDCKVCSDEGWIELLGCGLIHPSVLKMAGIDPVEFSGFAFGCGIDRLLMMKRGIEDVRLLHSGRLDFLKQFS